MTAGERFTCDCNGPVKVISDGVVEHACARKYAPLTSFYDGIQRFGEWTRVQVNPELTEGQTKYNWFFSWH